jgi:hypothetical protein
MFDSDFTYYMAFSESGRLLSPMRLSWPKAATDVQEWHRDTGEHGAVYEYRYDHVLDRSEYVGVEWRSKGRTGTRIARHDPVT